MTVIAMRRGPGHNTMEGVVGVREGERYTEVESGEPGVEVDVGWRDNGEGQLREGPQLKVRR